MLTSSPCCEPPVSTGSRRVDDILEYLAYCGGSDRMDFPDNQTALAAKAKLLANITEEAPDRLPVIEVSETVLRIYHPDHPKARK